MHLLSEPTVIQKPYKILFFPQSLGLLIYPKVTEVKNMLKNFL